MDKVGIVNLALGRIGVAQIEVLTEKSAAARTVNQFYDAVLDSVLRRYPWSFATRMVQLAVIPGVYGKYKYSYRVPGDCVMVRRLYDGEYVYEPRDNKYKIIGDGDGKILLSDIENAVAEYTARVKDTELFDSVFVEAFSWKLAGEMAFALTGNLQVEQNCVQAYNAYLREAEERDASEENVARPKIDRLARARFTGADEFMDER